jgi:hypothetical protein
MGYECPRDNIRITYSTYKILRAAGVPIEIYDPEKDKQSQEKITVITEESKNTNNKIIDEQPESETIDDVELYDDNHELETIEIEEYETLDSDNTENLSEEDYQRIAELENQIDEGLENLFDELCEPDELDLLIDDILQEHKEDNLSDDLDENFIISDEQNYKSYTLDELENLSRAELTDILRERGHVGGRDPYAVKQKDKRSDMIRKILATQEDPE